MDERDKLMYLAGLIDGEGHFRRQPTSRKGKTYITKMIGVTNVDERIMLWLVKNFGGHYNSPKQNNPNRMVLHQWRLHGDAATDLAIKLQPYLIIKEEQVKRIIPPYPIVPSLRTKKIPKANQPEILSQVRTVDKYVMPTTI